MTLLSSNTGGSVLQPEQLADLVVQPLQDTSVAFQVSTVMQTDRAQVRFPIVVADATAGFVAEGADIDESDPTLDELVVTPAAAKALVKVSNELLADSAGSSAAAGVIGDGLVRQLARTVDKALFASTTVNGPDGVGGVAFSEVDLAAEAIDSLDVFSDAQSVSESHGGKITAWVANHATAGYLAKLKKATDSNEPLLAVNSDVSVPVSRSILGAPLFTVPDDTVADGVVWAIDKSKLITVLRSDTQVVVSPWSAFASDSSHVRAVVRVGFAPVHPATLVRITSTLPVAGS